MNTGTNTGVRVSRQKPWITPISEISALLLPKQKKPVKTAAMRWKTISLLSTRWVQ